MTTTVFDLADVMLTAVSHASDFIKSFKDSLHVEKKDDGSLVTQVDEQCQKHMFSTILHEYPTLNIIGEEKAVGGLPERDLPHIIKHTYPTDNREIAISDLVVYVDPLDGTDCFVKKQYECVCVLLGITYKGKPFMGIVSQPFNGNKIIISFDNHVQCYPEETLKALQSTDNKDFTFVCSQRNDVKDKITSFPEKYNIVYKGGSGAKMVMLVRGEGDIYIHPLVQSCTWDTLAVQVILEALGGKVCDINGKDLLYPTDKEKGMRHLNGVVCLSQRATKYLDWVVGLKLQI
ncbi:bisphosphate 3'-nucleotidase 1, putative [Entamoeba invadens IP1]|uniref:3'(2'),5'-bisphosphate nucleotidase n=1 Tax=Entamoeba invadens IP1 TaxID=370355 RepID=A0A0A1TWF5_ENTIV|nr:bisphosphate 3'-nucleotidase 1, putative [Entamoeba invadens IP1]ELP84976.1 bisphosphate 3'-nucleotidase 1, putative [Entamoeba invadens IP1]|eukprot:XP_004184322.1 bisphosphate 3'-nucleotidase 1, putative [Entamoeba invadens IP1]